MSPEHALPVSVAAYIPNDPLVPRREMRGLPVAFRMVHNPPTPRQLREPAQRDGYEE